MSRTKTSTDALCPIARSVDTIGDRWSLLIVRDAFDGKRRFGDFQRSLGIARNILTDRLRELVEAGVLETQPASDGSAFQEYVLTFKGKNLLPVVVALQQWGERYLFSRSERHSRLVDRKTGKPIPFMAPKTSEGTDLRPERAQVRKVK